MVDCTSAINLSIYKVDCTCAINQGVNKLEEKEIIHLNYSLKTTAERNELVQKIIQNTPSSQLTDKYLEILGNYILDALPREEKKEKYITTNNRQITIQRRETSYEGLVSKFENGEDGVYNLINNDKNMYLSPKLEISAEDVAEIPGLAELREQIARTEEAAKRAAGKEKYLLKKQAIEMRQQQYILKEIYKAPLRRSTSTHHSSSSIELIEDVYFDAAGDPTSDAIVTFFKPEHISAILCNFEALDTYEKHKYSSDFHYMMRDFKKLMREGLDPYPAYRTLVAAKIQGLTNSEIQQLLIKKHNLHHTVEYISALWRNKIPKLLSEKAKEDYLIWYYTEVERGNWKKCTCCGQVKLAHNRFFSKNNTSKDGFYSICKECRKAKAKNKTK